jgi:hypothetical protein
MADNNGRTQLTIAMIGLFSAVSVALIANYDKIFPRQPAAVASPPQQAASGAAPPAHQAPPANDPAPQAPVPAGPAAIAGRWEDESDPFRFVFTQNAAAFAYTASENGTPRGTGKGTIIGRTLIYDFEDGSYGGSCRATLSDDGNHIGGTCKPNSGDPFEVRLRRAAG